MSNESLLVGAAQADITPELPVLKAGSFQAPIYADSINTPLTAQSIAWSKAGESVIWTVCDMGWVIDELADHFRQSVARQTGLSPEQVHVTGTHTHGGPTGPTFSINRDPRSMEQAFQTHRTMIDKAIVTAVEAYNNRQPAKMGYGSGRVERACYNRRYIMSNGRSAMHGVSRNGETRVMIEGPVDDQLQTVWFQNEQTGNLLAVMVNMASHPNQMYGSKMLCAEYPGVMRETVCRALDQNVPILFLQGACGNVQPRDLDNEPMWGRGREGIQTIGRLVAGEVLKQMHNATAVATDAMPLITASTQVDLTYLTFEQAEIDRVMSLVEQAHQSDDPVALLAQHFPNVETQARAKAVALNQHLRKAGDTFTTQVNAIRIGDVVFVTSAAHQFVEYQLRLKARFPGTRLLVVDLTDGQLNYIPTRVGCALGGYEVEHRRFTDDAGDVIQAGLVNVVEQVMAAEPAVKTNLLSLQEQT